MKFRRFEIAVIYFDIGIDLLIILAVLQEKLDIYRENWTILNHINVSVFLKQTFKNPFLKCIRLYQPQKINNKHIDNSLARLETLNGFIEKSFSWHIYENTLHVQIITDMNRKLCKNRGVFFEKNNNREGGGLWPISRDKIYVCSVLAIVQKKVIGFFTFDFIIFFFFSFLYISIISPS